MNAAASGRRRRFVVTATPPTTNGDLHVGHLSGPYLAADVFSRAQRLLGHEAVYVSGGDDHQTYVVTTAERLGFDPRELAAKSTQEIRETLAMSDVAVDAFTTPDADYVKRVQAFFRALHEDGKLARRRVRFPCSPGQGRVLFEAYAQGFCPECYASTCGAICEDCSHPNDGESLLFPRATRTEAGELESRDIEILVLPLEAHRAAFKRFYEQAGRRMRPRVLAYVDEMLSQPLPDFPISYPGSWGVPVALPGYEGQALNAWAEMLPALEFMTIAGLAKRPGESDTDPWAKAKGRELVQFLGFDNTFYFALAHLGLLFAYGRWIEPSAIVTNEFYHLENSKFSTSRRHLIWARDLISRQGADSVRFYLAINNPEQQVSNFTESEFMQTVKAKLHLPLSRLAEALNPYAGRELDVAPEDHALLAAFRRRLLRAYDVPTFSLRRAGEAIANLISMLVDVAQRDPSTKGRARAALGLTYLAVYGSPLLPGLARDLLSPGGGQSLDTETVTTLAKVVVPAIDLSRLVSPRVQAKEPMS